MDTKRTNRKGSSAGGVLSADYDTILGSGPSMQHAHVPIHVEPPNIDMEEDVFDLNERPIPREELQRKTQEDVALRMALIAAKREKGEMSEGKSHRRGNSGMAKVV